MQKELEYPTFMQINRANREMICFMYRFLPSPTTLCEELKIRRIVERFKKLKGFTPEISKKLGLNEKNLERTERCRL